MKDYIYIHLYKLLRYYHMYMNIYIYIYIYDIQLLQSGGGGQYPNHRSLWIWPPLDPREVTSSLP